VHYRKSALRRESPAMDIIAKAMPRRHPLRPFISPYSHASRRISRDTLETRITARVDLDGCGKANFAPAFPSRSQARPDRPPRRDRLGCAGRRRYAYHDHHTVEMSDHRRAGVREGARRQMASVATGTPTFRSTKPCRSSSSIFRVARVSLFRQLCPRASSATHVDLVPVFPGFVNHAGSRLHIDTSRRQAHHQCETITSRPSAGAADGRGADERARDDSVDEGRTRLFPIQQIPTRANQR